MSETSLSKECRRCFVVKPLEAFHKQARGPLGRHSWCAECANAYYRTVGHKKAPTEVRRWRLIKTRYGLTREQFDAMWTAQGGRCGICETALLRPKVDHDHETGAVRGLLCHRCNLRLGGLEDTDFRTRATRYLSSTVAFRASPSQSQESA